MPVDTPAFTITSDKLDFVRGCNVRGDNLAFEGWERLEKRSEKGQR